MSRRYEKEVQYLEVEDLEEGYSLFVQPTHSASLMAYFFYRGIPFTPYYQAIGVEDLLDFTKERDVASIEQVLEEWKQEYIALQGQKAEMSGLRMRLHREMHEDKKRVLRKFIRELSIRLQGKIRPQDYFTAEELKELEQTRKSDDEVKDGPEDSY